MSEPERQSGESELGYARRLLSASAIRALAADRWQRYRPWLDLPLLALAMLLLVVLFVPPAPAPQTVPPAGSLVGRTIVAPRNVTLSDPQATARRRQQAAASVVPVFDYDREAYFGLIDQVTKAVRQMAARKHQGSGDVNSRRAIFQQEIGQPVRPAIFDLIEALPDPDALAGAIGYFLDFGRDHMVVADRGELPSGGSIMLRDTKKSTAPPVLADTAGVLDVSQLRRTMWAHAADAPYGDARNIRSYVLETAAALVQPSLLPNPTATEAARRAAMAAVAPVELRVAAGEEVVRAGEIVTPVVQERIERLNAAMQQRAGWIRTAAFTALVLGLVMLGVWHLRRAGRSERPTRKQIYIVISAALAAALLSIAMYYAGRGIAEGLGLGPYAAGFLPPVALASVLSTLLIGPRASLLPGVGLALLLAFRIDSSVLLAAYYVVGSLAGILSVSHCPRRADLMRAGLIIGGVQAAMVPAIIIFGNGPVLSVAVLGGMLCAMLSGMAAAAVAAVMLPVFEQVFEEATDLKLLELAAADNKLLKQLALQSPGTYYHSMIMANLAEAAADAIGAKALQCRVMALYHDLGKTVRPSYFMENQRGSNIHDRLPPELSTRIIFAHIKDGIDIARKHHLGRAVLDAITQHQGTTMLRVFYLKALERAKTTGETVDENEFRYPGPRPMTKESGILLLADSVEAATRALKDPAPAELIARIRKIVSDKLTDGQLDDCALTMRDLSRVEAAFVRVLTLGVYHSRIEYPPMPRAPAVEQVNEQISDRSADRPRGLGERAP